MIYVPKSSLFLQYQSNRCWVVQFKNGFYRFLYLTELVVAQVEFLQSGPFVDRTTQIQIFDTVITEDQLSEVAGLPESRARQRSNVVGSHVH